MCRFRCFLLLCAACLLFSSCRLLRAAKTAGVPKGAQPVLNDKGKPTGKYRVAMNKKNMDNLLNDLLTRARYVQTDTTYVLKDIRTKRMIPLDDRFRTLVTQRWQSAADWWDVGTYDESRLDAVRTITFLDEKKNVIADFPGATDGLLYRPKRLKQPKRGGFRNALHELEQLYPELTKP